MHESKTDRSLRINKTYPLLFIDRACRQKFNKHKHVLASNNNKINISFIYEMLHPTKAEHMEGCWCLEARGREGFPGERLLLSGNQKIFL